MQTSVSIESVSPFRHSPERRAAIPATLRGEIPAWLRGEVVRTCPAIFDTHGWHAQHWFDGLGMIYSFRIGDAAVDFRSRLLDTEAARDAARGEGNLSTFGTPTSRSLLRRIFKPVPRITDNTNVNIVHFGDALVAMTEGNRQLVIDDQTLAAVGSVVYARDAIGDAIMTPHPHFDFARGRVVNVATHIGASGELFVYEHSLGSRQREVVGVWKTHRVPYVHAFGLTPRHAILVVHPFSVSPVSMLWSRKGYIDHFAWHPEQGTRLVVIDRETGAVREHVAEPFFMFHSVNAFERDGETVLDLLAYPDADIVTQLRVDHMLAQLPDLRPALVRVRLYPGVERATVETLGDAGFEFPAVNYKRVSGQPYRYAWGAADRPRADGTFASSIVKVDLDTGTSQAFTDDVHVFGEPLFVARPDGDAEDDGVLLTVGSSNANETSILAVIDAATMALVASAEVPTSIPLGFHGSFSRQALRPGDRDPA